MLPEVTAEYLSRYQFGLTAAFHIIFPATSIGLSWFLVLIHGVYLKTHEDVYYRLYKFWVSIFALTFTIGVVTGLFMSFQFGLNWSGYAEAVGPILGTIIGLEVMTAFFLEAGFLGIMLLGWDRVSEKVHFFATCMVACGTLLSSTWILGANSWMHTPSGFTLEDGKFMLDGFWAAFNNPSFLLRYGHMVFAAMITGSIFVVGVSAHYLLKETHVAFAKRALSLSTGMLTIFIFLQVWIGDKVAGVMTEYQPAKMAAIEGHWEDTETADWLVAVGPNAGEERNDWAVGIPYLGSMYTTKSLHGTAAGIKRQAPAERPPYWPVFYAFRVMFLTGITIYVLAAVAVFLRLSRRLYTTRWFLKFCRFMTPFGAVATVCGWLTAEIGRQPYVVFGQLRTEDAASALTTGQLAFSLGAFVLIYSALLATYVYYVLKVIEKGPAKPYEPLGVGGTAHREARNRKAADEGDAHRDAGTASAKTQPA